MYANELLRKELLPAKFVAFSHCFRKEAGRGEHSKGLYRLHQFSKVEMFALTRSDGIDSNVYSEAVLAEMVEIQKEIMEELEFPYRVLNMATEELGAAAFRKFDTEAWIPSKKSFGEVCSASNCTSYQSRRLNINYLAEHNEKALVHTVNGTALAVPRIILTLLETHYEADKNRVRIPTCLLPYLPFDYIEAKTPRPSLIHS